jgi:hypothetical protein
MNYYEEFGLRPDASPEEIRQAYRSLARLLHPDQQPDEGLRRLAEAQMRRVNASHDTLADPARRQQYDMGLSQALMLAGCNPPYAARRASSYRDAGLVVVGIAAASLYWQLASRPTAVPIPSQPAAMAERTDNARQLPVSPVNRRRARTQSEPAARRSAAIEAPARPTIPDLPPLALVEPTGGFVAADLALPPVKPVPAQAAASIEQVVSEDAPRLGGTWVYVRPRLLSSQRSLYPADYVETIILEEGAIVRGRYRARYDVADRPISAEVSFRFEGRAEAGGASLRWTGAGGAEGEAKLELLSRNSMRLDWVATTLGTQLGLASGTAVLTRRQEK